MTPFPTGGDLNEWQECRQTIGRLDTTIADLRKFGFSLVTVLITASGFFGQQAAVSFVSIAIMILIVSLFAVDRYYTLLLSGAVERALDLEGSNFLEDPRVDFRNLRLTQVISVHAIRSGAAFVVPVLYIGLLCATLLLASAAAAISSTKVRDSFWCSLVLILVYFTYTECRSGTGFFSKRRKVAT